MGLDMYLVGRKQFKKNHEHPELDRQEDGFEVTSLKLELGYWRKHPDLHGYIVRGFGPRDANEKPVDDCRPIELTRDHLMEIRRAVELHQLPHTEGFFFGRSAKKGSATALAMVGARKEEELQAIDEYEKQQLDDMEILSHAIQWLQAQPKNEWQRKVTYEASW